MTWIFQISNHYWKNDYVTNIFMGELLNLIIDKFSIFWVNVREESLQESQETNDREGKFPAKWEGFKNLVTHAQTFK